MSTANPFFDRSRKVVERFLQSAVIVDDQASLEVKPEKLRTPKRGAVPSSVEEAEAHVGRHSLNAKDLIDKFAAMGIVCSVLKPKDATEADLGTNTDRATQEADIVILDWNIKGEKEQGSKAVELIKMILESDRPSEGRADKLSRRMRLISIYTGEGDLGKIAEQIESELRKLSWVGGRPLLEGYRVVANPVTVVVYGKSGVIKEENRVSEAELPNRLVEEFTEMTSGLLSNVALESLSTIRSNTHRILSRFHPGIDAPYVAHRAMTEPPEEAEEHPIPLIAAEIEGVLADDSEIASLVHLNVVAEWLGERHLSEEQVFGLATEAFKKALLELLEKGAGKAGDSEEPGWEELISGLRNNDRSRVGDLTRALNGYHSGDDVEFACLTSLRSQYDAPPPVLKLGTIVAEAIQENQERYWLCIQPLCDSVRVRSNRNFPFLKLSQPSLGSEFDFVVPAESSGNLEEAVPSLPEHVFLKCSRRAHEMTLMKMKPDKASRSVQAERDEGTWWFRRSGKSVQPLRFVADLKTAHAQRVVSQFAGEMSRVGLMESEWLRRQVPTR